jgi:hypothetical protein
VAAAVGDASEFLDVDVEKFAGSGAFVAADGFAGGPVGGGQRWQAVALENPVGGRGGDTGTGRQPQPADAVLAPHAHDLVFHRCGCAVRQRGADALTRGRSDGASEGIHLGDGGLQDLAAGAVAATFQGISARPSIALRRVVFPSVMSTLASAMTSNTSDR